MTIRYLLQSLRRRPTETCASVIAVAVTVAFLVSLGSFVVRTAATLTTRAAARVPVDWQVQVTPGNDPATVTAALAAVPGVTGVRAVDYAKVAGLQSASPSGTRTTGAAYLIGLPQDYASFAPTEMRDLLGSGSGVALQQQTASNLAATLGTKISIVGTGKAVLLGGVVDLPNADSFFQTIGAAAGAGASAPPDNVLLVPPDLFSALTAGSTVVHQFHVQFNHSGLPSDPAAASDALSQRADHYVASVAGTALVGNNLGASLSAAREDALYARLLVLLLGVPGIALSAVVTALVISLRKDRQQRDLSLLRLRGASPRRIAALFGLTALADGLLGSALGVGGAVLAGRAALGSTALARSWLALGVGLGVLLALVTELAPVARLMRGDASSVREGITAQVRVRPPLALRLRLDILLLAGAGLVFWLTSRGGYKVVVVPEGVPVAAVNYAALLAPALAWPGMALLMWRVTAIALNRNVMLPASDPRGAMPDLRRQAVRLRRHVVARGATGLAIGVAVTLSVAVFTRTYDQQARVDTALSVGSDVAVTLAPDSITSLTPAIAGVPGVQAVEQVSHRLAYVGPDLQDLYGIDALTVGRAAPLEDAFTPHSSVHAVLAKLARTPDGALLSQETLHDYQLHPGDLVRLRLKDRNGLYHPVPFHVVGVVTEFATAPRDSFVLANRAYLSRATETTAVQTLLVRTREPARVAGEIHAPAGALVNDITAPKVAVASASGLAAGSLNGLARLTLGFGLLLSVASAALVLVVGAAQRRRSLVALAVLGASVRQRTGFLRTEARAVVLAGIVGGVITGGLLAVMLVKVLTGIFDPPPQHPTIPWGFVGTVLGTVLVTAIAAGAGAARWAARVDPSRLRDL